MIFGRKKNKTAPVKAADMAAKIDLATATDAQLFDVVCDSESSEQRLAALAKMTSQSDLALILLRSKYPGVRAAAAGRLSDVTVLRSSYQQVRQKDKNAARILKDKLDEIDSTHREQQQKVDSLHALMDESSKLATGVWSPAFNAQYQALLSRWEHVEDTCSMAEKLHFQANQRRIEQVLEEQRPRQEAPANQAAACESLELICGALQQASLMEVQIACEQWRDIIVADQQRWDVAVALCEPEPDVKLRYEAVRASLDAAINVGLLLNEASQAPDDFAPESLVQLDMAVAKADWRMGDVPIWFFELKALIAEVKENQQAQRDEQAEAAGEIHKSFASLRRALKDGRLIPAKTILGCLEATLAVAEVAEKGRYQEQLADLKTELNGLLDWQAFATKPKYEALCEAMDELAQTPIDAVAEAIEARVEAVKKLQIQWKELGRSDASELFWDRFQAAGHQAYEPAKLYFDNLQQQRQVNLQERQALCEQLTQQLEHAITNDDWKQLERQTANARRAWHNYRGVERKAGKLVKARFDHLLARIEQVLTPQYEANTEAKKQLIAKMEVVAAAEVNQHAVNQTKALQAAWKAVGVTPREQDQTLWQTFNTLCKQVFEADNAVRKNHRTQEQQVYDDARTLIERVSNLGEGADLEQFQLLQNQFNQLALPPREPQSIKLKQAYQSACDTMERQFERRAKAATNTDNEHLQQLAQMCTDLELHGVTIDADKWQGFGINEPSWRKAIERRKLNAEAGEKPSAASTRLRRLLCIQLEILLDQDTPRADKPLRMEFQLEQLQRRGQAQRSLAQGRDEIMLEWFTCLAAEPAEQLVLEQRFASLLAITDND